MTVSLPRLVEGLVATLRTEILPNIPDGYARGQAVGVIDLLNSIAPRVEWAREPVLRSVTEKIGLLRRVADMLRESPATGLDAFSPDGSTAELLAERDRLDGAICDVLARLNAPQAAASEASVRVMAIIKQHLHDELTREMKFVRKPLFAEIATGEKAGSNARRCGPDLEGRGSNEPSP